MKKIEHKRYTETDDGQLDLIGVSKWRDEWVGMPEFNNHELRPYAEIKIRVSSEEALQDLSRVLGQRLNPGKGTKSLWHPPLLAGEVTPTDLVWVECGDES